MSKLQVNLAKENILERHPKNEIIELIINSQLRTTARIDQLELNRIVATNNIEKVIRDIEECVDSILLKLVQRLNKIEIDKSDIAEFLKAIYYEKMDYDIIQKLEGIVEDAPMEITHDEALTALEQYKVFQKRFGLPFEDFLRDYKFENGEVVKK